MSILYIGLRVNLGLTRLSQGVGGGAGGVEEESVDAENVSLPKKEMGCINR